MVCSQVSLRNCGLDSGSALRSSASNIAGKMDSDKTSSFGEEVGSQAWPVWDEVATTYESCNNCGGEEVWSSRI